MQVSIQAASQWKKTLTRLNNPHQFKLVTGDLKKKICGFLGINQFRRDGLRCVLVL